MRGLGHDIQAFTTLLSLRSLPNRPQSGSGGGLGVREGLHLNFGFNVAYFGAQKPAGLCAGADSDLFNLVLPFFKCLFAFLGE